MRLPPPQPDPDASTIRRFVVGDTEFPRYMSLLGGGFVRLPAEERAEFLRHLGRDARQITDTGLDFLLQPNWRPRLVAGWMIGMDRRAQFRERLGELLLASELTYACEGYCIALAMLGTSEDAALLVAYLDHYLRKRECRYDQDWALGALLHLDDGLGSNHAADFLRPGGLWEYWADERSGEPAGLKAYIGELLALADPYGRGSAASPPA